MLKLFPSANLIGFTYLRELDFVPTLFYWIKKTPLCRMMNIHDEPSQNFRSACSLMGSSARNDTRSLHES